MKNLIIVKFMGYFFDNHPNLNENGKTNLNVLYRWTPFHAFMQGARWMG